MEEILKYENIELLYKFLMDDFGFVKTEEKYDSESFGNFLVTLSVDDFLLSYVNDRSFLTISIASKLAPDKGIDLSFVKDFIYNPENINSDQQEITNTKRIEELNNFLKKDFEKVRLLFSNSNYQNTRSQIDKLLKIQFRRRLPGMIND